MVGGEWHKPVHHKVMRPHEQDKDVDRQDPQHQEKDRVCKIGEIIMSRRFLKKKKKKY